MIEKYPGHPLVPGRRYIMKSIGEPFYNVDGRIKAGSNLRFFRVLHSIYDSAYKFCFWDEEGIPVSFTIDDGIYWHINWDDYLPVHPEDKDKPSW